MRERKRTEKAIISQSLQTTQPVLNSLKPPRKLHLNMGNPQGLRLRVQAENPMSALSKTPQVRVLYSQATPSHR